MDDNPTESLKTRETCGDDELVITDRLSKQCLVLKRDYGLSTRETEVCELIARGRSVAAIAEERCFREYRAHA